jgi:hypothetical protein
MVLPWSRWTAPGGGPSTTASGADATYLLAGTDSAPEIAAVLVLTWVVTIGALALRWRGGRIVAAAVAVLGVVTCPVLAGQAIQSQQRLWDGMDLVTGQATGGADVMRPDVGYVLASLSQSALLVAVLLAPARRPGGVCLLREAQRRSGGPTNSPGRSRCTSNRPR